MLQIIVAPPRSGKSYFAVNYLCKFTKLDELYNEYVLDSNVLIISNIEGLKIKHWKLEDCINKMSLETFFTIENFEAIQKKTGKQHIILCIDEAHRIFPKGFSNKAVYDFFAYHGHIGLDVIFMTQGMDEFTRSFLPLFEVIVEVTPRSKAVPGVFTYTYRNKQGKYLYSKGLKKKKEVFGAYVSFRSDEHNKPKNALLAWAIMTVLILGGGFGVFKIAIGTVHAKSEAAAAKAAAAVPAPVDRKPMDPTKSNDPVKVEPETVSAPVIVDSSPPPDPRLVQAWRVYHVEGYFDNGEKRGYMINGRVVMAGVCRNYDSMTSSVECYGGEIPERRGGYQSPPAVQGSGLSPVSAAEGGPLGQPAPSVDSSMVFPIQSDPVEKFPKPDKFEAFL